MATSADSKIAVPHDAVPHDAVPHDTVPHDTVPHDAVPHDAVPRDQVSPSVSDIETQIKENLHFTQHSALRCVTYSIDGDTVVLFGRVPSYYLKQLAQVKVACVPGIERVDNRIEVAVT